MAYSNALISYVDVLGLRALIESGDVEAGSDERLSTILISIQEEFASGRTYRNPDGRKQKVFRSGENGGRGKRGTDGTFPDTQRATHQRADCIKYISRINLTCVT